MAAASFYVRLAKNSGSHIGSRAALPHPTPGMKRQHEDAAAGLRLPFERRLASPIFHYFPVQQQALDFADKHGQLPVFAVDKDNPSRPGAKRYLVSGYRILWQYYAHLPPDHRCFYELVLHDQPCHLHVDAEFVRSMNPATDAAYIERQFRHECLALLSELYPQIRSADVEFYVLDSSSAEKYSKHFIVHIQGHYWKNNYHCGAFMRRLEKRILDSERRTLLEHPFYVWGDKVHHPHPPHTPHPALP